MGQDGAGWVRSKKSKLIPVPPCDAGLKSYPIPTPSPLQDGKNLCGAKQRGMGQTRWDKIVISKVYLPTNNIAINIFSKEKKKKSITGSLVDFTLFELSSKNKDINKH